MAPRPHEVEGGGIPMDNLLDRFKRSRLHLVLCFQSICARSAHLLAATVDGRVRTLKMDA
jgi:hypothetical protein